MKHQAHSRFFLPSSCALVEITSAAAPLADLHTVPTGVGRPCSQHWFYATTEWYHPASSALAPRNWLRPYIAWYLPASGAHAPNTGFMHTSHGTSQCRAPLPPTLVLRIDSVVPTSVGRPRPQRWFDASIAWYLPMSGAPAPNTGFR